MDKLWQEITIATEKIAAHNFGKITVKSLVGEYPRELEEISVVELSG